MLRYQYSKVRFPKLTNLFLACLQGLASYEHLLWNTEHRLWRHNTVRIADMSDIAHLEFQPYLHRALRSHFCVCMYWRCKAINHNTGSNSDKLLLELQRTRKCIQVQYKKTWCFTQQNNLRSLHDILIKVPLMKWL